MLELNVPLIFNMFQCYYIHFILHHFFCLHHQHNHKTVQEVIAEHTEADQREYHLGLDRDGNEYLHFPQFCGQDLRIYRRAQVPSPEVEEEEEDYEEGSILPIEKVREFKKMMKRIRSVSRAKGFIVCCGIIGVI